MLLRLQGDAMNNTAEAFTVASEHLASILVNLKYVRAGTESISHGLSFVPRLTGKQQRRQSLSNDANPTQSPIMQVVAAPQVLAAILAELTTTRRHMANVDSRLWFLPKRGRRIPEPPGKPPLATIGAMPQNLADIADGVRRLREDMVTMNRRLAWLSRKVVHPHQGGAAPHVGHAHHCAKARCKGCSPLGSPRSLLGAASGLRAVKSQGKTAGGEELHAPRKVALRVLPFLKSPRRSSSTGSWGSWRPSSDGEAFSGVPTIADACSCSSSEGQPTPTARPLRRPSVARRTASWIRRRAGAAGLKSLYRRQQSAAGLHCAGQHSVLGHEDGLCCSPDADFVGGAPSERAKESPLEPLTPLNAGGCFRFPLASKRFG
jgi:hypothetical protein